MPKSKTTNKVFFDFCQQTLIPLWSRGKAKKNQKSKQTLLTITTLAVFRHTSTQRLFTLQKLAFQWNAGSV
jgi:hypothetical protein